jgi:hypothetical protein
MASADPQARIAMLERALDSAQHELRSTSHELHWAQLTIQKKDAVIRLLEERLRKQRIGFLGPPSENFTGGAENSEAEFVCLPRQVSRSRPVG